jgi:hypothetical protein
LAQKSEHRKQQQDATDHVEDRRGEKEAQLKCGDEEYATAAMVATQ